MDGLRGGRIPLREQRVGLRSAGPVVQLLVALAGAGGRCGRKLELRQGRAKIEPGSAGHDRHPSGGENLVDRSVREACVLPDGGFVRERPYGHEMRGPSGLIREDRQPVVDLHGIGGYELRRNETCEGLRHGALPRRRRPEDPDHGQLTVPSSHVRSGGLA